MKAILHYLFKQLAEMFEAARLSEAGEFLPLRQKIALLDNMAIPVDTTPALATHEHTGASRCLPGANSDMPACAAH